MRERIKSSNEIVIKVGTSTLTHANGSLDLQRIDVLSRVLCDLKNAGKRIVLVSSGAIGVGRNKMHIDTRPRTIPEKQALAAMGQVTLMTVYSKFFAEYGCNAAQILLTADVINHEESRLNTVNTIHTLYDFNCIPVVNENDTVATKEIEFGDNDTLSAIVAGVIGAQTLIILSDIDGLYNDDPHTNPDAQLISQIDTIDDDVRAMCKGSASSLGTGGMATKLHAAEIGWEHGVDTVLINGEDPKLIYNVLNGEDIGTYFCARERN